MTNRFVTITILITAIAWAGFAVWLGFSPQSLLLAFGIQASTPPMLTEIRAFYGGVEFAIAATMFVLWWRHEWFAALLVGGLPLFGSACGRCIGLIVDGFSPLHLGFAGLEIAGACTCFAGCFMLTRMQRD